MRCWTTLLLATLALSGAVGCGGDFVSTDAGPTDAGGPDSAADAGPDSRLMIAEPVIPWLEDGVPPIQMTPCPEGWREVTERDVTVCDPYPEAGRDECAAGEAHFPGEPGCRAIGDPCPTGDYATTLPAEGPILYVNPAAEPGGDGSLALPYAALSDVEWATLVNTTVALSKGTFPGTANLNRGVHLIGACAGESLLTGATNGAAAVVTAQDAGAMTVLRNVTIVDAPQQGAHVVRGASLEVRGVVVEGALDVGILGAHVGTTVTLINSIIRQTRRSPRDGLGSFGIQVSDGAHIDVQGTLLLQNHDLGAIVFGEGSTLSVRDSLFHDSKTLISNDGVGIWATAGSTLELERVMIRGASIGVLALRTGTTLRITDSVFAHSWRDTDTRGGGHAVLAIDGPSVDLVRVLFTGQDDSAVAATDVGTFISVRDSVISAEDAISRRSAGFMLTSGAHIDATRLLIEHTAHSGVFATDEGTLLTLTDVVVRDPKPPSSTTEALGRGFNVNDGARVEATRLMIARIYGVGIFVGRESASVRVTDFVLRDTLAQTSAGWGGRGISVQEGARFEGLRLRIARSHDLGIFGADPGTTVVLTDAAVLDTMPNPNDGSSGNGIVIQDGGKLMGSRILIDGALSSGMVAYTGATADIRGALITHVRATACDLGVCSDAEAGLGVAAIGATMHLAAFSVRDTETCGVFVSQEMEESSGASLDLESGEVTGAPIGACVQVDGYDLSRLSNDVRYFDNGTNLASTTLTVPTPPARAAPAGMD